MSLSVAPIYDVVIMGAGPAGLTTAAVLKTMHRDLRICVLDHRLETTRTYGLTISKDATDAVARILEANLPPESPAAHTDAAQQLTNLFKGWSSKVVRVKVMEDALMEKATQLGVTIIRKDEFRPFLDQEHLGLLLQNDGNPTPLQSPIEQELHECFQHAQVVIGTDGRHSALRKLTMGEDDAPASTELVEQGAGSGNLTERENLEYFIEIKYETSGQMEPRSKIGASSATQCEGIGFETVGKQSDLPQKPATHHIFVGKTTYDAFPSAEHPMTLEELHERAKTDPILDNQLKKLESYVADVKKRGGTVQNERIKRLPIEVYRSTHATTLHQGRVIALAGDSYSGAVFARGVNKAFHEAALLAEATHRYFTRVGLNHSLPLSPAMSDVGEFKEYEEQVEKIFSSEKRWAQIKSRVLQGFRILLRVGLTPFRWIRVGLNAFYDLFQIKKESDKPDSVHAP